MIRTTQFANKEIYHICNRSVEGRNIFHTKAHVDYFLKSVIAANTTVDENPRWRRDPKHFSTLKKSPLVHIFCLTLLPNHFHFGVRQIVESGVQRFVQRVCNSFAKYFNLVEKRKGSLFMGRFSATHVSSDVQASHLITYIHANALDLRFPRWREGIVTDWSKAKPFLELYSNSSLPLYLGDNLGSPLIREIISRDFVDDFYQSPQAHWKAIQGWSERNIKFIEHFL